MCPFQTNIKSQSYRLLFASWQMIHYIKLKQVDSLSGEKGLKAIWSFIDMSPQIGFFIPITSERIE